MVFLGRRGAHPFWAQAGQSKHHWHRAERELRFPGGTDPILATRIGRSRPPTAYTRNEGDRGAGSEIMKSRPIPKLRIWISEDLTQAPARRSQILGGRHLRHAGAEEGAGLRGLLQPAHERADGSASVSEPTAARRCDGRLASRPHGRPDGRKAMCTHAAPPAAPC